ncbi:MAG: acyltransferase domain-containing protein, partial [Myxococcota bacterium]
SQARKVAFVFPGQGGQWTGMGRHLMKVEPIFANRIAQIDDAMRDHVSWSLLEKLASADWNEESIDVIQPTLFAFQIALVDLWKKWGVEPSVVIGHSMGEVAAAHVSGALNLNDALRVICRRSRQLLVRSGQGKMAVIGLPMNEVQAGYLKDEERVTIAAYNGPDSTVVSGDGQRIESVVAACRQNNVFAKEVHVDVASHSPQMDPLLDRLTESLEDIDPMVPVLRMMSTVTGEDVATNSLNGGYWARNLRDPVLLWPVIQSLASAGNWSFVEISPHPVLSNALERGLSASKVDAAVSASLHRDETDDESFLRAVGRQFCCGVALEWDDAGERPYAKVSLPAYAWHRRSCWFGERSVQRWFGDVTPLPVPGDTNEDAVPATMSSHSVSVFRERLKEVSPSVRHDLLVEKLQEAVSETLGYESDEAFETEQGFFQLGMDSRMVTSLVARMASDLDLQIEVGVVFKNPTIESFCGYLMDCFESEELQPERGLETDDELSSLAKELGYVE